MNQYTDAEELKLTEKIRVTKEVKNLLKKAKFRYRKENRKVSMSKLVCNLIIKEYGSSDKREKEFL